MYATGRLCESSVWGPKVRPGTVVFAKAGLLPPTSRTATWVSISDSTYRLRRDGPHCKTIRVDSPTGRYPCANTLERRVVKSAARA